MIGFNYAQLYQALQDWPVKSSALYLKNLNRMIYMGELRLIRDIDLDIFDVTDTVALTPAQTIVPKPAGSQVITFTGNPAQGANSANLTANWTGTTGQYAVQFQDNELVNMLLTNGQVAVTWTPALTAAQTVATATVAPLFVVEQALWVIYNAITRILTKRSYQLLQLYSQATAGQPKYYADVDTNNWIIGPATDANATALKRKYTRRPISIVAAGNTWLGDNVGEVLFAACLMEMEHFLKADDRYADMKTKYQMELLPSARGELASAWRKGNPQLLTAIATVPQPMAPPAAAPA